MEDNQLIFNCLKCKKKKKHKKQFNKNSVKKSANTHEFCGGDINKLIL